MTTEEHVKDKRERGVALSIHPTSPSEIKQILLRLDTIRKVEVVDGFLCMSIEIPQKG